MKTYTKSYGGQQTKIIGKRKENSLEKIMLFLTITTPLVSLQRRKFFSLFLILPAGFFVNSHSLQNPPFQSSGYQTLVDVGIPCQDPVGGPWAPALLTQSPHFAKLCFRLQWKLPKPNPRLSSRAPFLITSKSRLLDTKRIGQTLCHPWRRRLKFFFYQKQDDFHGSWLHSKKENVLQRNGSCKCGSMGKIYIL